MAWEQLRLRQNLCLFQKTAWGFMAFFDVNFIYRALNFCLNNGHTVTARYKCNYKSLSTYEYISYWIVSFKSYWVQGLTLYIWAFNMPRKKNIAPKISAHLFMWSSTRFDGTFEHILTLFVIVVWFLTQYCADDKIEKNEMGWACGAYGWGEGGV